MQVALRELRERVEGIHDSSTAVRTLREREQSGLDRIAAIEGSKGGRLRVLSCVLQQVPPWVETAYSLAAALRLRGHHVTGVLCDGVLPICEMNLGGRERPRCDVCGAWLGRYEQAFGFTFPRLTTCATSGDSEWAERLVAAWQPAAGPLRVEGFDLSRVASRELQRYRRGFSFDPLADPAYREWLTAAALAVRLFGRLLDREHPDVVIASSGRTLLASCVMAAARNRGIRTVTWDTEPSYPDGLVFSHGRAAVEVPLDDEWPAAREQPLDDRQRDALREFLGRWALSDGTPFPYNPSPIADEAAIRQALGLRTGAHLVVAFSNSAWDMAVVDRDAAFPNMFAWLFALVDYAAAHPEIDLVVRAHPAEMKVPADLQSRTPVAAEIRRRYRDLPRNVSLVDGESAFSSYTLAAMANVAIVYSSRLGLELAVGGRRPWLVGDVTYRGKGFTRDLESPDEMIAALDSRESSASLSDDERLRAERFAYLWFFRYIVRAPVLRPPGGRFVLESFKQLEPAGDEVVDRICDAIATGSPFLDLSRMSRPNA